MTNLPQANSKRYYIKLSISTTAEDFSGSAARQIFKHKITAKYEETIPFIYGEEFYLSKPSLDQAVVETVQRMTQMHRRKWTHCFANKGIPKNIKTTISTDFFPMSSKKFNLKEGIELVYFAQTQSMMEYSLIGSFYNMLDSSEYQNFVL